MGNVENPFKLMSNECQGGNHVACPGQILSPTGTTDCQCIHHKNTPTSVDDTPISSDTSWRVAHNS